jgi:hypothetical protein
MGASRAMGDVMGLGLLWESLARVAALPPPLLLLPPAPRFDFFVVSKKLFHRFNKLGRRCFSPSRLAAATGNIGVSITDKSWLSDPVCTGDTGRATPWPPLGVGGSVFRRRAPPDDSRTGVEDDAATAATTSGAGVLSPLDLRARDGENSDGRFAFDG